MSFGALAFLNPWLLAALATLPIIYWLLRTVPPSPHRVTFPPTRILVGLENQEKTPAASPWWLTLLRLLAAALLIFALAEPVLNPSRDAALGGSGPVAIVVDNGWASAARWDERTRMIEHVIAEAEGQSRPIVVVPTASTAKSFTARIEAPSEARSTAAALTPQPFAPDRLAATGALGSALAGAKGASIVWLSDDIDHDGKAAEVADKLRSLAQGGTFAVIEDARSAEPLGVAAGIGQSGKLEARVLRPQGAARSGFAHAISTRGQRLAEAPFKFAPGAASTTVPFDLPLELRNQVGRVEVAGERSAGAVSLIDARSQWHRVALISGESREQAQPLLAPLYYIEKALTPYAELIKPKGSNLAAGIKEALSQNASVLMLADIGTLSGEAEKHVENWVKKGGVLVRFAGPRLENGGDDLLPVPLRVGGRTLGGALSWSTPQKLAPIEDQSLFAGTPVPPEVTVSRQVLADPAMLGPDVHVWARLQDGTPLVTERKLGDGQIILFHVTANSDWSNLPLSGLFVEMLRRISALGGGVADGGESGSGTANNGAEDSTSVLPPLQTLDGFGILAPPPPTAQPVPAAKVHDLVPSLDHPPGYYGAGGSPRAVNVLGPKSTLKPLPSLPSGTERLSYASESAQPLKSWLLLAALALLFADIIAVILLQAGGLRLWRHARRRPAHAALILAVAGTAGLLLAAPHAFAQPLGTQPTESAASTQATDERAIEATSKVTLGYVLTGDKDIDEISRLGLDGLGRLLSVRTAVEPGRPMGVNILSDEIAFYPVLYWPVLPDATALPEETLAKIDAYMKQGGLIIFDTQDYGRGVAGSGAAGINESALQRIIGKLDVPRLEPVPENHVLTKAFYLLRNFPGRWDGGQLWVEALDTGTGFDQSRRARVSDGVTSIIVTPNDLAAAWALDEGGRPIYPTVGGGEDQREMAFRTGINIVMHALTGNYKADQVHVPALLERLGQ
ncbi:MAG: DUF4159 domain-containing protein [Hyphomicrobium sp.]|uniref:DUF4159 domain-containing protein n=1 Tax=Hyphomicrobium sp. TaxID=82 RepID=UPI0013291A55|nr:DUF4159 domain-containing protein [Hyphomicrobium sp.]KAB2938135.1 MAG: DUF4159 domain-containing protein [Hyphomicrobium sp.]MBZ0210486.1 DUF4159 domain-containing protein [Hyphomicrobium sp.]